MKEVAVRDPKAIDDILKEANVMAAMTHELVLIFNKILMGKLNVNSYRIFYFKKEVQQKMCG